VAVVLVAQGKTLRQTARYLGVSESTMQTSKRRLGVKILEFMGADIMIEARRRPQWWNSLEVTRERQACRVQRLVA
jgi:transposase